MTVGLGDTTPALVGDSLFVFSRVGAEENVICLAAADGKEIWRQKYAAPTVTGASAQAATAGPRSSPAVSDGKVVTFGVTGILTCWNAADGTQLWQKKDATTWPQFYTAASPLITDGLCVVQVGGNMDGGVAAYDLKSGDEKWKWTGAGPGYASPVAMTVAGTKTIVVLTSKSVQGIGLADGKGLWHASIHSRGHGLQRLDAHRGWRHADLCRPGARDPRRESRQAGRHLHHHGALERADGVAPVQHGGAQGRLPLRPHAAERLLLRQRKDRSGGLVGSRPAAARPLATARWWMPARFCWL